MRMRDFRCVLLGLVLVGCMSAPSDDDISLGALGSMNGALSLDQDGGVDGGGDGGASQDAGPATGSCSGTMPDDDTEVIPIFNKPFAIDYRISNHFDHNVPYQFNDTNGTQTSWCGITRTKEIDGHSGYDYQVPLNTPLKAPADGVVTFAGVENPFFCPVLGKNVSDQTRVVILHQAPDKQQFSSVFMHLSRIDVKVNDRVRSGQVIGLSGTAGCSTGPHLHFEVRRHTDTNDGRVVVVDPYGWQGREDDSWALHPHGAQSLWLWKSGQAPNIFPDNK